MRFLLPLVWLLLPLVGAFQPTPRSAARATGSFRAHPISARSSTQLQLSSITLPTPWLPPIWKSVKKTAGRLQTSLRTNEVAQWRAAALTFISSALVFRRAIDVQLARLWTHLMTSNSLAGKVFRSDSWEWCLAISCFLVYIHFFWYADYAVRQADKQGRVHPWKKYRLQDRFEADKHRRAIVAKTDPTNVADTHVEPPVVKQSKWNVGGWFFELWVYALPLLTWDILAPRRHRRLAPFAAPTTVQIMTGITMGLLLYDFLFFCGHWLMHKIPFVYKTIHAKHHKVHEARAGDVVRLSLAEEVLEVGFSIIALGLLSVHPFARSIYNCIITFLLTELHCGFDFPWTPQNVIPFGLATGSRRHHYHHRNNKHYYQKFFFTFDRLFGFFQKDDGSVHGDSVKPDPYIPTSWQ